MFVSASTSCFPELGINQAIERLGDLEYTAVEIALHEDQGGLSPQQVAADLDRAIKQCRDTHRMIIAAYSLKWTESPTYYEEFATICRLAKATKVVTLTVPPAELGTPFNQEIERLRELVKIAARDGIVVGLRTEVGSLTENPDTVVALCDNVKGLGVSLDPSHYICGPWNGRSYDQIIKFVVHTELRDTKKDRFQVRVGQGEIEYGKLITQLQQFDYQRALNVNLPAIPDVDHTGEMRKIRLLLESML
ncbi:MAG: sugar phosphate isomerase/epimerase [Pirellulales bacterium]